MKGVIKMSSTTIEEIFSNFTPISLFDRKKKGEDRSEKDNMCYFCCGIGLAYY